MSQELKVDFKILTSLCRIFFNRLNKICLSFFQLQNIQHHIGLTKEHIDKLNERFADYQHPPKIFLTVIISLFPHTYSQRPKTELVSFSDVQLLDHFQTVFSNPMSEIRTFSSTSLDRFIHKFCFI